MSKLTDIQIHQLASKIANKLTSEKFGEYLFKADSKADEYFDLVFTESLIELVVYSCS